MPKEKKVKKAAPAPKYYPGDDLPAKAAKQTNGPMKLRSSITPGTILILLTGHFRGRRCVFLKQLPSGLLLVTGPFSVNGVPLKRVNAAYVIATVTKVSLPKLPMDIDDSFFAKEEADEPAGEDKFFAQTKKATETSEERKAAQKKFDTAIVGALKDDKLKGYLKATFTLQKGDKPHNMVF
jgi:large subunit ribosomal protein L6e